MLLPPYLRQAGVWGLGVEENGWVLGFGIWVLGSGFRKLQGVVMVASDSAFGVWVSDLRF